ncbi:MAG: hypothetical protein Q4D20_05660 [Clostridia bacterium]|nr:hypothetical protein [Clostridia bacterium]
MNPHPTAPLGVLLSIETKQSNEKPNRQGLLRCVFPLTASEMLAMEQPLLCFHPCQNKNTTQNPLAPPTFHRLPKIRFVLRRIWKPNFPFAGEKGKYRLPMRLQRFCQLISLFNNTNPLLSLNHTLSWIFSQGKLKRMFSDFLLSADFLRWIYKFRLNFSS